MPIRVTEGESTGIYREKKVLAKADPAAMWSVLKGIADAWRIEYVLKQIEPEILAVLEDHGAEIAVTKGAARLRFPKGLSEKAGPIAKDAGQALHWHDCVRAKMSEPRITRTLLNDVAVCAFHLGRTTERMGVRPFEPSVLKYTTNMRKLNEGREAIHGDPAEKQRIAIAEFERILAENPGIKRTAAYALVAQKLEVSVRQVQRYLQRKNRGHS